MRVPVYEVSMSEEDTWILLFFSLRIIQFYQTGVFKSVSFLSVRKCTYLKLKEFFILFNFFKKILQLSIHFEFVYFLNCIFFVLLLLNICIYFVFSWLQTTIFPVYILFVHGFKQADMFYRFQEGEVQRLEDCTFNVWTEPG